MGTKSKDRGVGDGTQSSEATLSQSAAAVEAIRRMVDARASSPLSGLLVDVSSTDMLRDPNQRESTLRDLVAKLVPVDINPEIWDLWLTGGPAPFDGLGIERVSDTSRGLSRPLLRSGTKRQKTLARVRKARAKVASAEEELATAESALQEAVIADAALLEYVVFEHLVSIMRPMFAMGPAWILMRALSAHVPEEVFEVATVMTANEDIPAVRKKVTAERARETELVLATLDLWGGDVEFEEELRSAVAEVTKRYSDRDREGRIARSPATFARSLRDVPTADDRTAVVNGMRRRGSSGT
ncbi:MAG: hypothetical protein ABJO64_11270 [Nitratireductor sp.]